MTYAPTTLSILRLTHCIRIELRAAGVSLTVCTKNSQVTLLASYLRKVTFKLPSSNYQVTLSNFHVAFLVKGSYSQVVTFQLLSSNFEVLILQK